MQFKSIILATSLAVSANGAVLPALFGARAENSLSFAPTVTGLPFPTGTGFPFPTGTGFPFPTGTGFPFPTGTGAPLPIGTGFPGVPIDKSNIHDSKHNNAKRQFESGFPAPTGGIFPTGTGGGFPFPSGGPGFGGGVGSAQPTGAFGSGFGASSAQPNSNSYAVHSKNTIPAARRGWFNFL